MRMSLDYKIDALIMKNIHSMSKWQIGSGFFY